MAANLVLDNSNFSGNPPVLENVLVAAGLRVGSIGVASGGAITGGAGTLQGLTLQNLQLLNPTLTFANAPAPPLLPQQYTWVNASTTAGGEDEGTLQLFTYNNGGYTAELVNTQVPPRGLVGPPVVAGSQAIFGLMSPSQGGAATIPLGAATVAVANTAITAGSIIMLTGAGLPDATATSFTAELTPGVGFNIIANANATAAKPVYFFVVRY